MTTMTGELLDLARSVRDDFVTQFPGDAARVLEDADGTLLASDFAGLSDGSRTIILDRLSPSRAIALFTDMSLADQVAVIGAAPTHLALSLVPGLPEKQRGAFLEALPTGARGDLERLLDLPSRAVGRWMDRTLVALNRDQTVADAIERIRAAPTQDGTTLYLVDAQRRLEGCVDMRALALADSQDRVGVLATPAVPVDVVAPLDEVVELLEGHRADSLPVVDSDRRLLGVVRHDQLLEAVGDAASVDMQKMVGASPDEQALSTPGFAIRRRLPWLQINLLTAFLASAVVAMFEGLIAQFTALAVLLPVVAGQGGNAGAQALAVTVRGLALREIGIRELPGLLTKELITGIANGFALALVCGAGVYLWSGSPGLSLVISCAMLLSIPAAGVAGALVPMALTRLGQDPATASSIILTTVTDVAGFLSFLGIAMALSWAL